MSVCKYFDVFVLIPKLIIRVINFELTQHIHPGYHDVTEYGQTDRQTDGRTDDLRGRKSGQAMAGPAGPPTTALNT